MDRVAVSPPRIVEANEIARWIQYHCDDCQPSRTPGVTFLIGAGFAASTGIPTAGQMVSKTLRPHPLLKHLGAAPPGHSEYAFLMANLPPVERMRIIREAIDEGKDATTGYLRINWAHLLLATLVDSGYINQILTTNFDPLIAEALSLTGQPVRSFDLNASGAFQAGALPVGSVIYLHGQAHGLWLCNSDEELARVRRHLNSVFQDALRNSIFIVVGYSGVCDPVLIELTERFPQFRHRLYWVHYKTAPSLGEQARKLLADHYREAYLVEGLDADAFMRELVLEGLQLDLPLIVKNPLKSLESALARVMPFPPKTGDLTPDDPVQGARKTGDPTPDDPVQGARKLVRIAQDCISRVGEKGDTSPVALMSISIKMAAAAKSRPKLEELRGLLAQSKNRELRREIGKAYIILASAALKDGQPLHALEDLEIAESMDVGEQPWLYVICGTALSEQAKTKSGTEADALFAQAAEKYAEAVRIKPDMHDALNNWGNALADQANTKSGTEADALFAQAAEKYAEAVRIKPDMHEAWYNWGTALAEQAKTKSGTEADTLFAQAAEKYAEAVHIKPDMSEAWSNWGNMLLEQAKTKSGTEADTLFAQAAEKYTEAVRIKPDMHEAWSNWGTMLLEQARTKSGTEADTLFAQAAEKYAEAVRIKPDMSEAWSNWGNMLLKQAKIKSGTEADTLFAQAAEKYAEAVRIKPDMYEAWSNWGNMLLEQARAKSRTEADTLFAQAAEKLTGALRIEPRSRQSQFNMACLYALQVDIENAVHWLKKWADGNPSATRSAIQDEHDFDPIRKTELFKRFLASMDS